MSFGVDVAVGVTLAAGVGVGVAVGVVTAGVLAREIQTPKAISNTNTIKPIAILFLIFPPLPYAGYLENRPHLGWYP